MLWKSRDALRALALVLSISSDAVNGIDVDLTSEASIKSVASTIAFDMMSYYKGNLSGQIPGQLPGPPPNPSITNAGYFWWETGAMFGSMIDYWYYTGDSTYNDVVSQGIQFQVGKDANFLPDNQTHGMGNDDQGFWGMTAMTAAELGFPDPPANTPQWVALAQAVYNTQQPKIDDKCGGGLRWQAFFYENGYEYKNSIANGCFFNIASRLAVYTGNDSYAKQAESTWNWMTTVGFIDKDYNVFDGAEISTNCAAIVKLQYSYNAGVFLLGAATMYNYTNGSPVWRERVEGMLTNILATFFPNGIAYEVACEAQLIHCSIDMLSFKAYLTRWMAASTKVAPFIFDRVMAVLKSSATAAALQCSGSPGDRPNGRMCGLSWAKGAAWDGTSGVGQQMAALEVIQSNLIKQAAAPKTINTGGTSKSDPNAGSGSTGDQKAARTITMGDKAGAGILTALFTVVVVGGLVWLGFPDNGISTISRA